MRVYRRPTYATAGCIVIEADARFLCPVRRDEPTPTGEAILPDSQRSNGRSTGPICREKWCGIQRWLMLFLVAASTVQSQADEDASRTTPLPPSEAIEQFVVTPSVRVELVAAEPAVIDPVEIRFDERGRMWVVEMRGYPDGPAEGERPQSRIRVLEDRDGDGFFETAHTFADGLLLPTGLQPWREGVIVTMADRVVYLHREQGWETDPATASTPPKEELWLAGFAEQNEQLRANHPRLAPDGHIYVANGLRSGSVIDHRADTPAEPLEIRGRDVRFDPNGGPLEAMSGPGQFGMTFDEFGRRFICSNRNPLMHVVLEGEPTRRNPLFALPATLHDVAAAGEASRVYALTEAWTTSMMHAGQFTAACGVHLYRGNSLPEPFHSHAFVCEPTGSLVRCELMEPSGGTFLSHPEREKAEFLASRDPWFRPVNLETGPDGALYIVDMHRAVIEHPDFMPEELRTRRDLTRGNNAGRIYRVVAADRSSPSTQVDLLSRSPEELVAALDDDNGWVRETAFRLLYENDEASAQLALAQQVRTARHPEGRAWSLWTLAALDALSEEALLAALNDEDARVQEVAVQLATPRLGDSASVREAVIALAGADDARLRFCVALAIGGLEGDDARNALVSIARQGAGDVWTRRAIATAQPKLAVAVTTELLAGASASGARDDEGFRSLLTQLCEMVGRSKNVQWTEAAFVAAMEPGEWSDDAARGNGVAALTGLARGLSATGQPLSSWLLGTSDQAAEGVERAEELFTSTVDISRSTENPTEDRNAAIEFLRYGTWDQVGEALLPIATGDEPATVKQAAINSLRAFSDTAVAEDLLGGFNDQTPAIRRAMLDLLLSRPAWCDVLLTAIEAGDVDRGEFDPLRRAKLTEHKDPALRQRGRELLARETAADRAAVIEEYTAALELPADTLRGREVFKKNCASCHRVAGVGVDVAPDIADSYNKKPPQLLTDILDPNRAIDSNYVSYTVITTDGQVLTGIIASETATAITLRQQEDRQVTLLRDDIDELHSNGLSLMPEGLEQNLSPQQMADVIRFIKNWRYLESDIPLGEQNPFSD